MMSRSEVRVGRSEGWEAGGSVDELAMGVGVNGAFMLVFGKKWLDGMGTGGSSGVEDEGQAIARPNQDQEPWSGRLTKPWCVLK